LGRRNEQSAQTPLFAADPSSAGVLTAAGQTVGVGLPGEREKSSARVS